MTVLLVLSLFLGFLVIDTAERSHRAHALGSAPGPGAPALPGGSFLSKGHAWVRIEPGGEVRVGIDAFAQMAAGPFNRVDMPVEGQEVRMGEPLFSLRRGRQELHFLAPVSGRVVEDNEALLGDAEVIASSPYLEGWICRLEPTDLAADLRTLRIGSSAQGWCDEEGRRLEQLRGGRPGVAWADLEHGFLAATR